MANLPRVTIDGMEVLCSGVVTCFQNQTITIYPVPSANKDKDFGIEVNFINDTSLPAQAIFTPKTDILSELQLTNMDTELGSTIKGEFNIGSLSDRPLHILFTNHIVGADDPRVRLFAYTIYFGKSV